MAKKKRKPKIKAKPRDPSRRKDYQVNDLLIEETFLTLYFQNKKLPSYEAIAEKLKVDVSTVKRHVKDMDFKERFERYRLGSGQVIANLFKQAATGRNKDMIKMWLELFEELGAKKKVDITSGGKPLKPPSWFDGSKL